MPSLKTTSIRLAACILLFVSSVVISIHSLASTTQKSIAEQSKVVDLSTRQGVQEMVISVKFMEQAIETYQSFADYELLYRGIAPAEQATHWGLSKNTMIEQAVLRAPDMELGFLRLVKFHDVEQVRIRSSARPFDSGGIFNINMRAKNLERSFEDMRDLGFLGFSDPTYYVFAGGKYGGAMLRGHDGVVVNLLTRVSGDYSNVPTFQRVSHIINSTQMVGDFSALEINKDFLSNKLGWTKTFDSSPKWPDDGANNMSLPNSLVLEGNIKQRATGYKFSKDADGGSIELFSFNGIAGNDFSDRAHPPNLGVLMYRVHVPNIDNYAKQLSNNKVAFERPMAKVLVPPYGTTQSFVVATPSGAWIEFFEQLKAK